MKKDEKNKKRTALQYEGATDSGGGSATGSERFRLVVTDDGNVVLERGSAEVMWKALDQ